MAIYDIENFLLDFAGGQHVGPLFLLPLPFKELQVVPQFLQHIRWLSADFLDHSVLRDHIRKLKVCEQIGKAPFLSRFVLVPPKKPLTPWKLGKGAML
jgi:hypothetical protein